MTTQDIVQVNLSAQTGGITQTGFGSLLIVGPEQHLAPALVKVYSRSTILADLVTDGYSTSDRTYKAAQAAASADNGARLIYVGRRTNPTTMARRFDVGTPTAGEVFEFNLQGTEVTVTADSTPTAAEVAAALVTALGSPAGLTLTDNTDGTFDIAASAGQEFSFEASVNIDVDSSVETEGDIAADLNAILNANSDWYGLCVTSRSEAEVKDAAAWTEAQTKLYAYATAQQDAYATAGLFSDLQALSYQRTVGIYSPGAEDDFHDCAILSRQLGRDPGSSIWAFKTLPGAVATPLSTSVQSAILGFNGNFYTPAFGRNIVFQGRTPSGTPPDETRGKDWLKIRSQERVALLLFNSEKIGYTNDGVQAIMAEIRDQFDDGLIAGFLAADPAPAFVSPDVNEESTANKAARRYTLATATARLAGAIESTTFAFTLTL